MALLDYSGAIKITFDRPIINDPTVVLSTEAYKPIGNPYLGKSPISSSSYSGYTPATAFNGSTGDLWCAASGAVGNWIGLNFNTPTTIDKIRLYVGNSTYTVNGYEIQGSDDGSAWTTVATGNFSNAIGWNEATFEPTSYQYWRLITTSMYNTGRWYVYELEFCETRNVYDVSGWTVTSQEYRHVPGAELLAKTHTVRKVTRSADMLSVTLWLDMYSRMKAPAGLVTVAYDKTLGNLKGMGNLQVESFTLTFTPANITPVNNALVTEFIELTPIANPVHTHIYYTNSQGEEHITLTPSVTATLIHIDDLEQ